jgi:UDP-glucose 4-epimerase
MRFAYGFSKKIKKNMNVLITGGAGYIGTELVYLLNQNEKVKEIIIYDNLSRENYNLFIGQQKLQHGKIKFVYGELLDSRKLKKVIQNIDVVYHLAAKVTTPFADQNAHFFEQTNNWGTAELIYAVEESKVQTFVYLSSISVYGASSEEITIHSALNPKTFYGISKMRGEEHVQRLSDKIKTFTIRCGNVYGYNKSMRFDSVINKFMFDANFKGKITINGDGNQRRTFVHVQKVAEVMQQLLYTKEPSTTFNLVDKIMSINDIAAVVDTIYPEMEMLFINQHLKLRELIVKNETTTPLLQHVQPSNLEEELREFKKNFAF